jgi:hypothetical protein
LYKQAKIAIIEQTHQWGNFFEGNVTENRDGTQ